MRRFTRALLPVFFIAAALLATATNAPASPALRESGPQLVDVMDVYLGTVNMNHCCDCHATFC